MQQIDSKKRVFISYAREDNLIAKKLYFDLKCIEGIIPWIDCEDMLPGQKWQNEIYSNIKKCTHFLALLSSNSITKKGYVQRELKIAFDFLDKNPDSNIYLIPIRVDECAVNDEKLQSLHRVDMFASYEQGLEKIILSILGESHHSYAKNDTESFMKNFTERIGALHVNYIEKSIDFFPVYEIILDKDFVLNINQCLILFPPTDFSGYEVLHKLTKIEATKYQVSILICFESQQRAILYRESKNLENMLVTPNDKELHFLLFASPSPKETFYRIISSQIKLSRISPYQIGRGVDKDSLFFGRHQIVSHIVQRKLSNYFVIGGRQLGKSTLLKAINVNSN